jgi:hypothetical protein
MRIQDGYKCSTKYENNFPGTEILTGKGLEYVAHLTVWCGWRFNY